MRSVPLSSSMHEKPGFRLVLRRWVVVTDTSGNRRPPKTIARLSLGYRSAIARLHTHSCPQVVVIC